MQSENEASNLEWGCEANSSLEFTCLSRTLEPLTFIVIGGFAKDSQQLYGKFCQNRFLFMFSKGPIKTDKIWGRMLKDVQENGTCDIENSMYWMTWFQHPAFPRQSWQGRKIGLIQRHFQDFVREFQYLFPFSTKQSDLICII